MLLAKSLNKLPNDICWCIKEIILEDHTYNRYKNEVYIDANDILFNFNETYDKLNTLITLFNPKIDIRMHYSSKAINYNRYVFFENELPEYIFDDWFYGLDLNKIIMKWDNTYFR
jgi:hypothetical protein